MLGSRRPKWIDTPMQIFQYAYHYICWLMEGKINQNIPTNIQKDNLHRCINLSGLAIDEYLLNHYQSAMF